ncbi:MAG: DNA repair protein RadC [Rickettsiales bacterium]|jgi:DNA repair protein RadC|nr:DNA repair protein RadC [Rickettsiales bacterium]
MEFVTLNSDGEVFKLEHKRRLLEKFLESKLLDYEILELMLTYATRDDDTEFLADKLIKTFGGVHGLLTAPLEELESTGALARETAIFIKAIYEIILLDYKNYLEQAPIFNDTKVLKNYCQLSLSGKTEEEFHVMYIDADNRLMSKELHSKGTVDHTTVYPREILKRAININAAAVVLVHNHTNVSASFSTEDINATIRIMDMLRVVNILVCDHLLVAGGMVYSAREMHLLD